MVHARKTSKSLRSPEHLSLQARLVAERRKAGLNQADVAARLGKPQSYVAKYEGGERRLDVVEFILVCKALGIDAAKVIRTLAQPSQK